LFTEGKDESEIGSLVSFPELFDFEWLAKIFIELGMLNTAAYSPSIILYSEIESWVELNAVELSAWEVDALRHMSQAYLAQLAPAAKEDCPAPFSPEVDVTIETRKKVSSFLQDFVKTRKQNEGAIKK
jgi:hypothetical protein